MKAVSALAAAIALAQAVLLSKTDSAVAAAAFCPRMLRGTVALAAEVPSAETTAQVTSDDNQEDEEMHRKRQKVIVKKIAIPVPVPVEVPQYVAIPIPISQPAVVASSSNTVVSDSNVAVSNTAVGDVPAAPGAPGVPGVTPAQTRPGGQPVATPAASIPRVTPMSTVPAGLAGGGVGMSVDQPGGIGDGPDSGALDAANGDN